MTTDPFQTEVARLFLSLRTSASFALAGGAGLLAHAIIDRTTQDLDMFADPGSDLLAAAEEFTSAARDRGWEVGEITKTAGFVRLTVTHGGEMTMVDLAIEAPAATPLVETDYGRTLSSSDLAARKVLALFDRAAARDFADVYKLRSYFDEDDLIRLASALDTGFDTTYFADMLRSIRRFEDDDIPLPADAIHDARAWFEDWAKHLR